MWDSNSLNNQGQLACSLVMGMVFVVLCVLGGWGGWDHSKHTESLSQAIFHMYLYMFAARPLTGQVHGKNFDACTAALVLQRRVIT